MISIYMQIGEILRTELYKHIKDKHRGKFIEIATWYCSPSGYCDMIIKWRIPPTYRVFTIGDQIKIDDHTYNLSDPQSIPDILAKLRNIIDDPQEILIRKTIGKKHSV
jgi:hypothetical protein